MKNILIFQTIIFSLFLLSACSTTPPPERPATKEYSHETNRMFEMIERASSLAQKKDDLPPELPLPSHAAKIKVKSQPPKKKEKLKATKTKEEIPETLTSPPSERDVEIEQNLAFYCMKHRKNKKFQGDEKKCNDFATARLKECQAKHRSKTGKILSCIKTKLK